MDMACKVPLRLLLEGTHEKHSTGAMTALILAGNLLKAREYGITVPNTILQLQLLPSWVQTDRNSIIPKLFNNVTRRDNIPLLDYCTAEP
jgi:hypothetical protein